MKFFILLILLTATVFANIGQITSIKGSCAVTRDSAQIDAYIGFKLEEKDVVNTKDNTKIQIVFKDRTIVSVGKLSTFDISEYIYEEDRPDKVKVDFKFLSGAFKSITGKIGKIAPTRFKIKTSSAVIGIRGTTIVGNQEKIACTNGEITVSSHGVTQILPAGMFSKTPPNAPPTPPKAYVPGSIETDIESSSVSDTDEETEESNIQEETSTKLSDSLVAVEDDIDTNIKIVEQDLPIENLSIEDIASDVTADPVLNNLDGKTADLIQKSTFGDDYLELGYWETSAGTAVYPYISGVVTSSNFVDKMIKNSSTATYSGGLSSIVTGADGVKTSSSGSVNLDFDFSKQNFAGNVNVTEGDFKADIAGSVHKYGFDSTTVSTAVGSTATEISGNLNGQFYGSSAEAAGGTFNLNSSNAGSVSGVFGINK